jgi:hypothetical protein
MKFLKTNSFNILLGSFFFIIFLVYVFNKGVVFGEALAK